MEGALTKIEALMKSGQGFHYNTVGTLEPNGQWITSLSPNWLAWIARVEGAIHAMFGDGSAPARLVFDARRMVLVGNGEQKFKHAKSLYLGALGAAKDIVSEDVFGELKSGPESAIAPMAKSNRIFIVHGHDDNSKNDLELLLREFGLDPIVLHRQADGGRTLIEKFEHYSDVGFAFVILTPDEIAFLAKDANRLDSEQKREFRARPNAIFEFGFFVGRLGRGRTCCLYKHPVVVPSDIDGLVYKRFNEKVEEVAYALQKELRAAGYKLV